MLFMLNEKGQGMVEYGMILATNLMTFIPYPQGKLEDGTV